MDALPDVERGRWLLPRLSTDSSTMHVAVPRGYPAYARIFHPVERDRPLHPGSRQGHSSADEFLITSEQVSWTAVAEAFGTVMHPLAQFHRLIGSAHDAGNGIQDPAGWRYFEPATGSLDAAVLTTVARHLVDHTTTPTEGVAAVWEGWGGLTSSAGQAVLAASDGPLPAAPGYFVPDGGPGSGILPQDVVNGPVLELPGRSYYLFSAGARYFAETGWPGGAPWHDGSPVPQSPSMVWPNDHSWVLATEIDWDSTIVAGSWELVKALVSDPSIEALPVREGADLRWDSDNENRPPDSSA